MPIEQGIDLLLNRIIKEPTENPQQLEKRPVQIQTISDKFRREQPLLAISDRFKRQPVATLPSGTLSVEMRPFAGTEEEWQARKATAIKEPAQGFSFLPPNIQSLTSAERPGSPGWVAKKLAGPLPEMGKAVKETRWRDLFNLYGEAAEPIEGNVEILGQEVSKQALLDALFLSVGMTGNLGGKVPKVPKGKVPKAEPGFPEAGIQPSMLPEEVAAKEVRPAGKGRITQISMDEQLKLERARRANEAEGLTAFLEQDPVATFRFKMGQRNVGLESFISVREQSFPDYFTVKQAQALNPEKSFAKYTQKGTKDYNKVPRDVVLDDLTKELKMTPDEIADRVMEVRRDRARIRELSQEVTAEELGITEAVEGVPEVSPPSQPATISEQVLLTFDDINIELKGWKAALEGVHGEQAAEVRKAIELLEDQLGRAKAIASKPIIPKPKVLFPEAEPIVPSMAQSIDDIDKALNDFGTKIASKEMRESLTSQSELWAVERGTRAENFAKLLDDEIQKGTDAKTAIEKSLAAFKDKFLRQSTGLSLPDDVRNAAYNKIIKVISADVKFTPKQQSFEIAATKKALDNALAGNPVPDIPGIKGGSAKSRLLKIFAKNPVIKEIIENPKKAKSTMSGFLRYEPTGELPPIEQAEQMSLFKGSSDLRIPDTPMAQRIAEARTDYDKALAFYKYYILPSIKINPAFRDKQIMDLLYSRGIQPSKLAVSQAEEAIAYRINQQFSLLPISSRVKVLDIFRKIGVNAYDMLGIPKSLKFAYDVSIPFRQGFLLGVRHPISWAKMWKPYFQAMRSEELSLKLDNAIRTDPASMVVIDKMGIDLYTVKSGATYMERPESMASKIAERFVPGVRISNRGAAVSMNSLMANVAKTSYKVMQKMGSSEEEYKAMGALINELAGRGTMPKVLQGTMGDFLNKLMTSPRYTISRFEWPVRLFSSSKAVRQEAAATIVAVAGLGTAILTLAKLAGASVEIDPRSSDAYKVRIGGKRIDFWVGYAQIIRLLAQLSTGQRKDPDTGKITSIPRSQVIGRYFQSKESPGIGSLVTILSGKNYVGEKIDMTILQGLGLWSKETFAPAALEEMLDAYVLEGGGSAALSGIGTIGVGVSTYESDKITPSQEPKIEVPKVPKQKPRFNIGGGFKAKTKPKIQLR